MEIANDVAGSLVFLNVKRTTDESCTDLQSTNEQAKFLAKLPPVDLGELKITLEVDQIDFNEQNNIENTEDNQIDSNYQLKCETPEGATSIQYNIDETNRCQHDGNASTCQLKCESPDVTMTSVQAMPQNPNDFSYETIVKHSPDGKRTYVCKRCPRFKTSSNEKLIQHQRRHRGENPFQCNVCEYSTYNSTRMQEHSDMHKGIRPYKCSKCSYSSSSKKNTKKHELKHQRKNSNDCSLCDFYGKNRLEINEHMAKVHSKTKRLPQCGKCTFKCKDPFKMAEHKKTHTIECTECGEVLANQSAYSKHMQKLHNPKSKDLYHFTCEVCKWSSALKPKILLHLIHHPLQSVDETKLDISVLRKYGIIK